jgi:DNA-binding transcriptional MerR regulator
MMIRSYTVDELERLSGVTKRTIGDYISKGLLAGPSHRGRGARYPQADADALRVVPRLRTLMKQEFPTVDSVAGFLRRISRQELRNLACQPSEKELELEVRRIRVRLQLSTLLPKLAPERLATVVDGLSPDQVRGIDTDQYQIGAVLDLAELFRESGSDMPADPEQPRVSGARSGTYGTGDSGFEHIVEQAEAILADRRRPQSKLRLVRPSPHVMDSDAPSQEQNLNNRLADIADRLERLERILAST